MSPPIDDEITRATLCDYCGLRVAYALGSGGRPICTRCEGEGSDGTDRDLPDEPPPGWCGDSYDVDDD